MTEQTNAAAMQQPKRLRDPLEIIVVECLCGTPTAYDRPTLARVTTFTIQCKGIRSKAEPCKVEIEVNEIVRRIKRGEKIWKLTTADDRSPKHPSLLELNERPAPGAEG